MFLYIAVHAPRKILTASELQGTLLYYIMRLKSFLTIAAIVVTGSLSAQTATSNNNDKKIAELEAKIEEIDRKLNLLIEKMGENSTNEKKEKVNELSNETLVGTWMLKFVVDPVLGLRDAPFAMAYVFNADGTGKHGVMKNAFDFTWTRDGQTITLAIKRPNGVKKQIMKQVKISGPALGCVLYDELDAAGKEVEIVLRKEQ